MPKLEKQRKSIKIQPRKPGIKGSALIETLAGLFILLPVFFLLVDVIALVIAQSVNDDLAKQAARYAVQVPAQYNTNGTINTSAMQTAATNAATNYIDQQLGYVGSTGLICQATLVSCNFDPVNGAQVVTQIRCNLPIPVPFGGPSYTDFKAQFTYSPINVQPTVNQTTTGG
jgi:Flp pilus assembly protein TadG